MCPVTRRDGGGWRHGRGRLDAVRRSRIMRPTWRQVTGHRTQVQCILTGPLGHVVVGLVRPAILVLEPSRSMPRRPGEGVELLVGVGHQVGPPVVDRAEPGRLAPVIEIDGHGRMWVSGARLR